MYGCRFYVNFSICMCVITYEHRHFQLDISLIVCVFKLMIVTQYLQSLLYQFLHVHRKQEIPANLLFIIVPELHSIETWTNVIHIRFVYKHMAYLDTVCICIGLTRINRIAFSFISHSFLTVHVECMFSDLQQSISRLTN